MTGSHEMLKALRVVQGLMAPGEPEEFWGRLVQCTRTLLEAAAVVVVLDRGDGYGVATCTGLEPAAAGVRAPSLAAVREQLESRAGVALWVPLESTDPKGMLGAFAAPTRRFSPEDGELLSTVAGLAGTMQERALRRPGRCPLRAIPGNGQKTGRLESVLDQVADGLVLLGPSGRLVQCNQTARVILNLGEDGTLRAALSLSCPQGWVRCTTLDTLYRSLLSSGPGAYVLITEGLAGRWYDVTCTYVRTEGGDGEFLVLLHDVTHHRQADAVTFNLLPMAAHEIRTPLTAIHGYLSLLGLNRTALPGALAPPVVRALDGIQSNVDRLLKLLSDLMDVTRLDGRTRPLNRVSTDVGQLIRTVLAETAILAERQRVEMESELGELGHAHWDQQCIAQLLSNLLSNAIKFSPSGGRVRISARASASEVVIAVSDSGPGIPPAERELIFQPFWRGDHSRQTPGSGLGLTICRRIVDAHRGRIGVESQLGEGTSFVVELPRAPSAAPPQT